jgi:ATP-dependent RNA helicase RhlE
MASCHSRSFPEIHLSHSFALLGLSAELTRAVDDQGYSEPTPVQAQAIPVILAGRDVLAGAQTGTGKTAGFTLPLLQRLATRPAPAGVPAQRSPVRALILTPTRELAAQIEESVRTYGKYLPLKSTLIYGGVNINPQIDALRRGVDILVATPGRLLDHLQQKTVSLAQVEILVLDEADRMLDMGFIRDIRRILALLPAKRQNLLFSATFSNEIRKLADGLLHAPAMVEVARRNAESELVAQRVHPVDSWRKRELLTHLVASGDWRQVLVFTRMKSGANRLAEQLCKVGIEATAIHGNKSQPARTRALAGFKAGTVRVLVATDIAARGLDIEELPHVVNFELPHVPEDYVHRIGRTGRAGSTGEAISLVSPEERPLLADIEKLLTRRIDSQIVPGFEPGQPVPPEVAAAAAQAGARGAQGANRRGGGGHAAHGRDGGTRSQGSAATPARPTSAHAAAPAHAKPTPLPNVPRAPQRGRTDTSAPLPALFRSPARRGG